MSNGAEYLAEEIGYPYPQAGESRGPGNRRGWLSYCRDKNLAHARIGETITLVSQPASEALPGFKEAKPMVFCGLYPAGESNIDELRDALEKLKLNDASLHFEPEHSPALGFGFRAGFLGLLHREIIQERLEREFNLNLITTAPSVSYRVVKTDGQVLEIHNPSELPEPQFIERIEEPIIEALILTPDRYLGPLLQLLDDRRGQQKKWNTCRPAGFCLII